ncbi:MAG: hypothetical protein AB8B63_09530 [Granulosicoccus sp.]
MPTVSHIHSLLLIIPCLITSACSETVIKDDPSTSKDNAEITLPSPLLPSVETGIESSAMQEASILGTEPTSELSLTEKPTSPTMETSTADTQQSGTDLTPVDNMNVATLANRADETVDSTQSIELASDTDDLLVETADDTISDTTDESTTAVVDESKIPEINEAPMATASETDATATDTEVSVDKVAASLDTDTTLPNENDLQEPQITNASGTEPLENPQSDIAELVSDSTDQVSASVENPSIQTEPTTGAPGAIVNCRQTVPCHWISEDSQFTVSVTNADNISSFGNLAVQFSISAQHDSQVNIARAEHALDTSGKGFKPAGQALGDGNGITPQTIVAGEKLEGTVSFDDVSQDMTLAEWSVALIDGGMIRSARFTNIPVGPLTKQPTDCDNALPCVWESPDEQVKITLLSVGNISTGNRLTANFSVETMTDSTVALDAGSSAVGTDGTRFSSRTHTLAGQTAYENVVADTRAFALLAGSFYFFKSTATPDSLQDLSLVIYEDKPVPRWNPRFTAVPVF